MKVKKLEPICIYDPDKPEVNAEEELEKLFKSTDQKRKVVVLSNGGNSRDGKSFLMDFFIRYLSADRKANWLDYTDEAELEGFRWERNEDQVTHGITIWPEIFEVDQDFAVIVMDCQGVFDAEATLQSDTYIFSLSTIFSSVQIFKVKDDLRINSLKYLNLFTDFGRMLSRNLPKNSENQSEPFQKLAIVVRDWANSDRRPYGWEGGKTRLKKLQGKWKKNDESAKIWKSVSSCFDSIECFLMPSAGEKVIRESKRKLSDIDKDFMKEVKPFVEHFFLAENLKPKLFQGRELTIGEFVSFVNLTVAELRSGKYPVVDGLLRGVAAGFNDVIVGRCVNMYESEITAFVKNGPHRSSIFESHLNQKSDEVLNRFSSSEKFNVKDVTKKAKEELKMRIHFLKDRFRKENNKALRKRSFRMNVVKGAVAAAAVSGIFSVSAVGGAIAAAVVGSVFVAKSLYRTCFGVSSDSCDNDMEPLLLKKIV